MVKLQRQDGKGDVGMIYWIFNHTRKYCSHRRRSFRWFLWYFQYIFPNMGRWLGDAIT